MWTLVGILQQEVAILCMPMTEACVLPANETPSRTSLETNGLLGPVRSMQSERRQTAIWKADVGPRPLPSLSRHFVHPSWEDTGLHTGTARSGSGDGPNVPMAQQTGTETPSANWLCPEGQPHLVISHLAQ